MSGADNAETPFKQFRQLAMKLAAVPKSEVPKRKPRKRKPLTPKVS